MAEPVDSMALEALRDDIDAVRTVTGEEHEEVRARLRSLEHRVSELETAFADLRRVAAKRAPAAAARAAAAEGPAQPGG